MNIDTSRERTARLRNISLQSILLATGAQQDPHDKKKWHTIQGAISIDDIKFMNWNRAQGGGGAIDLIIHLYGLNFKSATSWLHSHFPEHTASNPIAPNLKPPLKLPSPAPEKLNTVKQYLNTARRIPAHLIDRLIQRGDLYADHSANAVFLMRGKHHIPIGAELRGTGPHPWRGMATGSNKNTGGFFIRKTHIEGIVLCEQPSMPSAASCIIPQPAASPPQEPDPVQRGFARLSKKTSLSTAVMTQTQPEMPSPTP